MDGTIVTAGAMVERLWHRRSPRTDAERSDSQLVAGASHGDALALAALFDRYGGLAYGVAIGVTRNTMLAQDAVQEAFVQLWCKASSIDMQRTSIAAWITLLARRRAIDITRREARATGAWGASLPECDVPPADELALVSIESSATRAALESLTAVQREVLVLAYYHGLSQREIASSLAVPIGTVKSRTGSALASLRCTFADADRTTG